LENEGIARKATKPQRSKKSDYIAAIFFNAILLVIANQILNWGILPFLTQDFKQVLPIQSLLYAITIVFNAVFLFRDPDWLTAPLKMVINAVGIAMLVRYSSVFPFDFSGSSFDWAVVFRVFIIIGFVAHGIAIMVEIVKFFRAVSGTSRG
jgi:hypothetical protein